MLAGGLDQLYRLALTAGHEPYSRFEVWRGTVQLADDLTIINGSVQANLASQVTRDLDLALDESYYPAEDGDLLAPFGNEIHAFRGIRFAEGSRFEFPVFVGRIDEALLNDGGQCVVHAQDRANDVISNKFPSPENSQPPAFVVDEVRRIISGRLVDAKFGAFDSFRQVVPILTWEEDPGRALDELSTACGAFWYSLADGQFVMRRYPWTVAGDPIVTFSDGDGGTVTSSNAVRMRNSIYNSIVVTGERLDGTAPTYGVANDDNPTSPTYFGGPFGVRRLVRRLNTPTTDDMCVSAANQLLKRATAFTEAWSFTTVPDAALELGDVISLNVRGRRGITQVVQSISMPLDTLGTMRVGCRAQVINQLADSEV